NSEITNDVDGFDNTGTDVHGAAAWRNLAEVGRSPKQKQFGLASIQLQTSRCAPATYINSADVEGRHDSRNVGWWAVLLCLDIVSEQMIEQSMLLQKACDVFSVLDEPFRSQYRSLRNTIHKIHGCGLVTTGSDDLRSVL